MDFELACITDCTVNNDGTVALKFLRFGENSQNYELKITTMKSMITFFNNIGSYNVRSIIGQLCYICVENDTIKCVANFNHNEWCYISE